MRKAFGLLVAVLVLAAVLFLPLIGTYNHLVSLREEVREKWAQVETQLQRRLDLIPNLVNTVKGYASHEQEIFDKITQARAKLAGARTPAEAAQANQELSNALSRLLVLVEDNPELKANETFNRLMDELAGTENRIAVARRRYNQAVRRYNTLIQRFPTRFIAQAFGFQPAEYFEAAQEAEQAPKVQFP